MSKKIISLLMALSMVIMSFNVTVFATVEDEEDIPKQISTVKSVYKPGETYFVSDSTQEWVGEDNIDGDKTLGCFAPGTTNSHGRFGGLWQSMGFANYVFYNIFGEIPQFGYHCNPGELNNKIEVIGRCASRCKYIRGQIDAEMSESNLKTLLSNAKQGDILVVAPKKDCYKSGRAMIIMNVTNMSVTVYQADYKGNCAVTEDTITYDALSDYHCVTLLRSTDYPYAKPVPPDAVERVTLSDNDFSLNENVTITWPMTKNTEKYKVFLVDENNHPVSEGEFKNSVTSFVFKNAGKYRVKVIAKNQYGDSEATYSSELVVHNQNVVTFKDYDGTVITTQKVEYGKNAVAPNVPQREGYQFAGWDKSLENITMPTDITATYEARTYTIKYYDVGGKNILFSESVKYQEKANPPTNYTLTNGYVFAGWQISYDSVGTDYNCVDGDMTLIATEKWVNPNLPITITINNAYRAENGTKYTASIVIKNNDSTAAKNVKILGSLKGADGKSLKIVVLYELSLKANESVTKSIEIVYSEKATKMEFVAVGMVGNSKTGGAFSKTASATILDNTSWGSWTDWTTSNLISSYDAYETKTQYRYRNKTYTTATSSSLSGWTKYNTTSSTGSWSSWSNSAVSAFTNDAQKREVQTQYIQPKYKTQYRYGRWTDGYYTHFCPQLGKSQRGGSWYEQLTAWQDSAVTKDTSTRWTCSYSGHTHRYPDSTSGSRGYWYSYKVGGKTYYWQETRSVQTAAGYYQYQYRDTFYTYHFWKWGDWSSWSDTYKSGDETDTRTLYRYRNRSTSGDPEDTSGEFFSINGTLNNVEADFNGMTASIMVYKRCNTDPTDEQLEYVGQTTIGKNNTYSFEFKPKEMPTSETGEFIIALGIEGADRLVNVDIIEAEVPSYQVRFVADGVTIEDPNAQEITDSNGNTFKAQLVKEGRSAIAPEPPAKEGHTFVKWSETLTDIKADKVISAEYEPIEYSLVFIDWDTNMVTTQKFKYGDTIIYPTLEPVVGTDSRTWDKQMEGVEFVTDNMIIGSVSELKEYTVTFMIDDTVISTQSIKHGQKATIPEQVPAADGMVFADWVGTCSHEYITQDSIFKPAFLYSKTVSMPEADVTKNSDGSSTVALSCDTEGAQIYYVVSSCCEEASLMDTQEAVGGIWDESIELMEESETTPLDGFRATATPYTGEFTLASDETVTFIAYADGMNESIPVVELNENEELHLNISVKSCDLQEYRDSIKGQATFTFENNLPQYSIGSFFLCFYDQRGFLLNVVSQTKDIIPGQSTIEFKDICVENIDYDVSDTITCKLLTWFSGEEISPLSDSIDVNIK